MGRSQKKCQKCECQCYELYKNMDKLGSVDEELPEGLWQSIHCGPTLWGTKSWVMDIEPGWKYWHVVDGLFWLKL